jgi:hypothetical protein
MPLRRPLDAASCPGASVVISRKEIQVKLAHELLRLDIEPKQIAGEDQYHHSAAARRSPSPTE